MSPLRPADEPKHKGRAVLLALFFGFAAWSYTYKADAKKFWIAVCLNLLAAGALLLVFKSLLSGFSEWLDSVSSPDGSLDGPGAIIADNWWQVLAVGLTLLGLWLWPVIDIMRRPANWYEAYGVGKS
ncbi:hypothetical protein F4X86_03705 [Candidatus Saccharibacteria bacterium]|nr:hypothetical protein [Candidatus Saccharibacteria bacterium]